MNIVLADDEPLARSRLRRLLEDMSGYRVVGEAADGEALVKLVRDAQPDVALIDIHMPGMDGLHAARELSQLALPPAIIFTTAYSEHALSAFGTTASSYLLKPIKREQLQAALLKARRPNQAQVSAGEQAELPSEESIEVRERDRLLRVPLSQIFYCQAEDKYTRLVWQGGEHLIDQSLKQIEVDHPQAWLRVHRKVLVMPAAILGLEKHITGYLLLLRHCDHKPPVSRRLVSRVRELLSTKPNH